MRSAASRLTDQNPLLIMCLALCPALVMTKSASTALALGLTTAAVMLAASLLISILVKIAPPRAADALSVLLIAALVTVADMIFRSFFYDLSMRLGIFVPLIAANYLVLRQLRYNSERGLIRSAIGALADGAAFAAVLFAIAVFRELLGNGSLFDLRLFDPVSLFFILPPGALLLTGLGAALFQHLRKKGSR